MTRNRAISNMSSDHPPEQELDNMYDYLAKIILLGPSGSGKTCLLHRYIHQERRQAVSQTIGLEFSSRIVRIGTGTRRKRIKLQFWDTAGTERFRAVSRPYYRGAAGAIIVYDITSLTSLNSLSTFLNDLRELAPLNVAIILAGNKSDLDNPDNREEEEEDQSQYSSSYTDGGTSVRTADSHESSATIRLPMRDTNNTSSSHSHYTDDTPFTRQRRNQNSTNIRDGQHPNNRSSSYDDDPILTPATSLRNPHFMAGTGSKHITNLTAPEGREVSTERAMRWASENRITTAMEVSAHQGTNVDELFTRIAEMILIKIELGEVDPGDSASGVQYGDMPIPNWDVDENDEMGDGGVNRNASSKGLRRRRQPSYTESSSAWREWGEVFGINSSDPTRVRRGCC